jgi:hypothetical protein
VIRQMYEPFDEAAHWPDQRKWRMVHPGGGYPTSHTIANGKDSIVPKQSQPVLGLVRMRNTRACEVRGAFRRNGTFSGSVARFGVFMGWDGNILDGTIDDRPLNGLELYIEKTGDATLHAWAAGVPRPAGAYAVLTAKAPSNTLVYDFRLVREDAGAGDWRLRCKIWARQADGTPNAEPGAWDFDVADDGYAPTTGGIAGWVFYTNTAQASMVPLELYPFEVKVPNLLPLDLPQVFTGEGGMIPGIAPYAAVVERLKDEPFWGGATPSWITDASAALAVDAAPKTRKITCPGNATRAITLPVVAGVDAEAILLTARGLRLDTDGAADIALRLVGAAASYELRHNVADTYVKLIKDTAATDLVEYLPQRWTGGPAGEGPRHRDVGLLLLPNLKQMIALTNGLVAGWLNLDTAVAENLTPTLEVRATTATAKILSYAQLELAAERD